MRRLLRLLFGYWSPSLVLALRNRRAILRGLTGVEPPPLGLLDRWELRNHEADCKAFGGDPMMPSPGLFNTDVDKTAK